MLPVDPTEFNLSWWRIHPEFLTKSKIYKSILEAKDPYILTINHGTRTEIQQIRKWCSNRTDSKLLRSTYWLDNHFFPDTVWPFEYNAKEHTVLTNPETGRELIEYLKSFPIRNTAFYIDESIDNLTFKDIRSMVRGKNPHIITEAFDKTKHIVSFTDRNLALEFTLRCS